MMKRQCKSIYSKYKQFSFAYIYQGGRKYFYFLTNLVKLCLKEKLNKLKLIY